MTLAPLPVSTATTTYDLLLDVRRIIDEEPRRMDIGNWAMRVSPESEEDNSVPACGTVGCIAGWMNMLTQGFDPNRDEETAALRMLTGGNAYSHGDRDFFRAIHDLFSGSLSADMKIALGADWCYQATPEPRSREHADLVIARIDRFLQTWETRLRATPLVILRISAQEEE